MEPSSPGQLEECSCQPTVASSLLPSHVAIRRPNPGLQGQSCGWRAQGDAVVGSRSNLRHHAFWQSALWINQKGSPFARHFHGYEFSPPFIMRRIGWTP